MVKDALANGNNFEPCCAEQEKMAALLVVDNDATGEITHQVIIAEIPLPKIANACPPDSYKGAVVRTRPPTSPPASNPTSPPSTAQGSNPTTPPTNPPASNP